MKFQDNNNLTVAIKLLSIKSLTGVTDPGTIETTCTSGERGMVMVAAVLGDGGSLVNDPATDNGTGSCGFRLHCHFRHR